MKPEEEVLALLARAYQLLSGAAGAASGQKAMPVPGERLGDAYVLAAMRGALTDWSDEQATQLVEYALACAKHACLLWGHVLMPNGVTCDRCGCAVIKATIYKMGDAK